LSHFERIKEALQYVDGHLGETIRFDTLAEHFHFSPYYFHRIFLAIVGKSVTAYVRDRRLARACMELASTDKRILDIGLDCGFGSAQSFSRAFRDSLGLSPTAYREQGCVPDPAPVEEMIRKFTNRLKGGIYVHPRIIRKDKLIIAGVSGDGNRTGEVWQEYMKLSREKPLPGKCSEHGYEVRRYENGACTVHVGVAVPEGAVDPAYAVWRLPASKYAAFDVYVLNGYDSENSAMDEWLATNAEGYRERLMGEAHYCVEFYD